MTGKQSIATAYLLNMNMVVVINFKLNSYNSFQIKIRKRRCSFNQMYNIFFDRIR